MLDFGSSVIDNGLEQFSSQPALQGHLASAAFRGLAENAGSTIVVDLTRERRALKAGMLLAVALTMAERWRTTIPGNRVGVVFPSGIGGMVANLALTLLDKTPVNLNFTSGRKALEACIRKAGIQTVITAAPVVAKLPDFPWPEHIVDLLREREQISKATILKNLVLIRTLPIGIALKIFKVPTNGGAREAGILFSSGSTGEPKGIVLSHTNVLGNCLQIKQLKLLDARQRLLACLPTFHSFGFTVTLWYPMITGMPIVTMPSPLETKRIAEAIQKEQATVMMGTPTFFRPYFSRIEPSLLKSLRFVVGGAEKTPTGFHDRWESTFGSEYLEGYGLTETSPVVSCNLPEGIADDEQKRSGSVGKLFPGMAARITDPVSGAPRSLQETGILELKGPNIFNGYLDDRESTKKCFNDGWFVTGDLVRFDSDGFLFIEGRISRFSKIGGEMVPHGTIEQTIMQVFHLTDAEEPLVAVTGIKDDRKGEALVLLTAVEIKPDILRDRLLAEGIPTLWVPRTIKRVDHIPCLASGKLDLRALNQLAVVADEAPDAQN